MNLVGKPNEIWVDKGSDFYNRSIKSWFEGNDIELYLTHSESKSIVAKRFIRTWKNKIHKYMTSLSKNVRINKLNVSANKACDKACKMNHIYLL